ERVCAEDFTKLSEYLKAEHKDDGEEYHGCFDSLQYRIKPGRTAAKVHDLLDGWWNVGAIHSTMISCVETVALGR
ncbi:hypothetical protein MNBD_PLANCTO02-699, partial [hydrothermal vent metagenome]